ncbi:hypothetical protein D9M68_811280 [compost metagenome]
MEPAWAMKALTSYKVSSRARCASMWRVLVSTWLSSPAYIDCSVDAMRLKPPATCPNSSSVSTSTRALKSPDSSRRRPWRRCTSGLITYM